MLHCFCCNYSLYIGIVPEGHDEIYDQCEHAYLIFTELNIVYCVYCALKAFNCN